MHGGGDADQGRRRRCAPYVRRCHGLHVGSFGRHSRTEHRARRVPPRQRSARIACGELRPRPSLRWTVADVAALVRRPVPTLWKSRSGPARRGCSERARTAASGYGHRRSAYGSRPHPGRRPSLPARPRLRRERRDHHDVRGCLRRGGREPVGERHSDPRLRESRRGRLLDGSEQLLARRSYADAAERADGREALRHGSATTLGFLVAGTVPLVAYLAPIPDGQRFVAAVALTATTLYVVGALRALVTKLGWVRSGLEMLFVGATAAAVAFAIGALASALTGT